MTDQDILDLYRSGAREEAFRHIMESYNERIYWHIRRFVISHDDADDIMQDVLIKIWSGLPSFRDRSKLFTWIYRIATNESLNFLRKSRIRSFLSIGSKECGLEQKLDEDPYFNGTELQKELYNAMETLPPKQKAVFALRYFDEMKYEDISEITGCSAGSLKASYHHAYNKIKEYLEKRF